MKMTFTDDNRLTIARIISTNGVKPTVANVTAVADRLQQMYRSNFEQDIQDAINEDEESN